MKIPDNVMFSIVCLHCDDNFGDSTRFKIHGNMDDRFVEGWLYCDNCGYGACISGESRGKIIPVKPEVI